MRKPNQIKLPIASTTTSDKNGALTVTNLSEIIQGYNNLVSSLKLVRKYRPFAENDNLPKICQPEDHIEVSSPRSSSSEKEKQFLILDDDSDLVSASESASKRQQEAVKAVINVGDPGSGEIFSDDENQVMN